MDMTKMVEQMTEGGAEAFEGEAAPEEKGEGEAEMEPEAEATE